jgi:hypothetical protein
MVDPPTYRTEPDPEFADRLERVLLRRLTGDAEGRGSGRRLAHGVAPDRSDIEAEHGEGDMVMLDTTRGPAGPAAPRRRSSSTWLLVAAALVVVAVVGTLLAAGGDEDDEQIDTVTPTPTTTTTTTERPAPDGMVTKSLDPDGEETTPLRITYQVPKEGWNGTWFGATKYLEGDADGFTGLSITTVTNLVTDACRDHTPLDPPVGPTVDDLATALSQLTPFEITAPPTDVTMFGYQGKHLELTVPDTLTVTGAAPGNPGGKNVAEFTDCVEGELYSWFSPINEHRGGGSMSSGLLGHSMDSRGAFNAYQTPGQTEEFWILDVDGTRVVLVKFDSPMSPPADLAQRDAIFDSIRIEP